MKKSNLRTRYESKVKSPGFWMDRKIIFGCFLLLATQLFWLLATWPGTLSGDSVYSWSLIKRGIFDNSHPLIYELYLRLITINGNSIVLASYVQTALLDFCVFLVLKLLLPSSSNYKLLLLTSLVQFTPGIGGMGVTMWADIPFTALVLIGISLIAVDKGHSISKSALGVFALGMGSAFRHEGILTLFIFWFLVALFIFAYRLIRKVHFRNSRRLIFLATISIMLNLITTTSLNAIIKPTGIFSSIGSELAMIHDLAYVEAKQPGLLNQQAREVILGNLGPNSIKGALECESINAMYFNSDFDREALVMMKSAVRQAWLKSWLNESRDFMLQARACRSQAYLAPIFATFPKNPFWLDWGVYQPNDYGLKPSPPIEGIRTMAESVRSVWVTNSDLLGTPGLNLIMVLLFSMILVFKGARARIFLLFIACLCLARVITLLTFGVAQDYRYSLILHVIFIGLSAALVDFISKKAGKMKFKSGF